MFDQAGVIPGLEFFITQIRYRLAHGGFGLRFVQREIQTHASHPFLLEGVGIAGLCICSRCRQGFVDFRLRPGEITAVNARFQRRQLPGRRFAGLHSPHHRQAKYGHNRLAGERDSGKACSISG
ncbi:hypothetical protein D3C81_1859510 [compost metagenome]